MSYNCPHNKITKHINKFFNILFSVICGAKTNLNSGKYSNQSIKKKDNAYRIIKNITTQVKVFLMFSQFYTLSCLFYGLITVFPAIQICFEAGS